MIEKVAIIGAGQLGSRHLQAVSRVASVKEVFLVDPSESSLQNALQLYHEVAVHKHQRISLLQSIESLPSELDYCIVSTSSLIRREATEKLLEICSVKYLLLEKFLFPKLEDYEAIGRLFEERNIKAWVNCPRRLYPYYKEIKEKIGEPNALLLTVTSSNILVGTHAIHFIDLFMYLTKKTVIDSIDVSGLHKTIYDSKRSGYIEFKGNIIVRSGNCTLIFQSYEDVKMPLQVSITQHNLRYMIMEWGGIVAHSNDLHGWKWSIDPFDKPLQSQLTNIAIEQVNNTGDCDLTPYEESTYMHESLLKALLTFMGNELSITTDICTIT